MKRITLCLIVIFWFNQMFSQGGIVVNGNAGIVLRNGSKIILKDMGIVNQGTINQDTTDNNIRFLLSTDVSLSGNGTFNFSEIILESANGSILHHFSDIYVKRHIYFAGANINLNASRIFLGSTGRLFNESESSRIYTADTGYIEALADFSANQELNPGNLGASLISREIMGKTIVRRGHKSHAVTLGNNSVQRYYDIIPSYNQALKATFNLKYFNAELDGHSEDLLYHWTSKNLSSWQYSGAIFRSTENNEVVNSKISKLYRTTLAIASPPEIICPQDIILNSNQNGCKGAYPLNFVSASGIPQPDIAYLADGIPVASDSFLFPKGVTIVSAIASNGIFPNDTCIFSVTVQCSPRNAVVLQTEQYTSDNLPVDQLFAPVLKPNPTHTSFELFFRGSITGLIRYNVFDAYGKLIESKSNIAPQSTHRFGAFYKPGTYFIEIIQGKERKLLKAVKL